MRAVSVYVENDAGIAEWARWRTLRQMAWHVADTESRYYLPSLGLGYRERAAGLFEELELSAEHTHRVIEAMPAGIVVEGAQETWTRQRYFGAWPGMSGVSSRPCERCW
ncbi:MAG: hypothetical protein ACR2F6_09225 [Mycobacteriales bacterium]